MTRRPPRHLVREYGIAHIARRERLPKFIRAALRCHAAWAYSPRVLSIRPRLVAAVLAVLVVPLAVLAAGPASAVPSPDLVISQVYGGGGNSGAPFNADFIELFNRGDAARSTAGLSVQYASAAGMGNFGANTGQLVTLPSVDVPPGGYVLVGLAGGANGVALPAPDATGAINMSGTAGKVALATGTTSLGCNGGSTPCSAEQLARIIDLVGYGNANFFEGATAAPTLSNTTAALRAVGGCTDSDENGDDFVAAAPAPRNSATALAPCGTPGNTPPTLTPNPFSITHTAGTTASYTATAADDVTVAGVTVDSALPLGVSIAVSPPGQSRTITVTVADTVAVGDDAIAMTLTDDVGASTAVTINVSVTLVDVGCDAPASHQIADVQGTGDATPLPGQAVRVEGIVTGDFQGADQLRGFFVQDDTPDDDPNTSEGLFVFSTLEVNVGDRVLVNGQAIEFNGLTELSPVTAVDVCGNSTITPTPFDLPRPEGATFEPFESTLLTFPEPLTATEHFQLGRFGEVTVSSEGRLFQPTELVEPGAPAQALLAENARRRLLLDDGSTVQNPPVVPYLDPPTLRIGDTASGITGVLSFGFGQYRLQPTAPIAFARTNPRPLAPDNVGGDVQVASFNTLNYFTTLADTNPNGRGADTTEEFARQQAKEVAAITGLDADVVGLMEVENNGSVAIGSLVDALNAATAPDTYAFVAEPEINPPNEFGGTFGTDAIKVAFIYKPAVVTPMGPAETSTDEIFDRPPLIQTFRPVAGGEDFTVAVNHFKSKGCGGGTGADADQGDGQSCFNARRVAQATRLAEVVADLSVTNALIIGDLNAYAQEDPINVLEDAGYAVLSEMLIDNDDRYSFVFDGFSGELDHALAAADLLDNVTGATIWHINADEPLILDYNTEFNPPSLFEPDAYRSSDHDPLVVGLDLTPAPPVPTCRGLAATILGSDSSELLFGTNGADVIIAFDGNDAIFGLGGDDTVCAGDGNDVVFGGAGHDTILGQGGSDALFGETGNDTLAGGAASDVLSGGPGDDTLLGGPAFDALSGGSGTNTLSQDGDLAP